MAIYHLTGEKIFLADHVPELAPYIDVEDNHSYVSASSAPRSLSARVVTWIGGRERELEAWFAPPGMLLKTIGGSDFYIAPAGTELIRVDTGALSQKKGAIPQLLSRLDREIILGPALILALAMRGTWSLHASAARFKNKTIAFLGESGRGKSTLTGYLSQAGWQRVADDILPVTVETNRLLAWPRFPQLKLPPEAQPGLGLPEHLSLDAICLLEPAALHVTPSLEQLSIRHAVEALLRHTAGTRLFWPELLAQHLAFCTQAQQHLAAYHLSYPHSRNALSVVKRLLESIC